MFAWPVTQPTGYDAMTVGAVVTAAVDTTAPAGAASRLELATPVALVVRPTADSRLVTAFGAVGFAAALTALALGAAAASGMSLFALRVVSLFDVRAEEAVDFGFDGPEDPVLDELCDDEPESPEPDPSAHAAPAPARIATPTPKPTARPPIRPTYIEALFVEPILLPLRKC